MSVQTCWISSVKNLLYVATRLIFFDFIGILFVKSTKTGWRSWHDLRVFKPYFFVEVETIGSCYFSVIPKSKVYFYLFWLWSAVSLILAISSQSSILLSRFKIMPYRRLTLNTCFLSFLFSSIAKTISVGSGLFVNRLFSPYWLCRGSNSLSLLEALCLNIIPPILLFTLCTVFYF